MKKKIVALSLVVAMVVMNNVVVWGAVSKNGQTDTADALNDTSKRNVNVKYTDSNSAKYSIEITWGDMNFTATPGEWNPLTHRYGNELDTVSWSPEDTTSTVNSNHVVVTNHSNDAVKVTFNFDGDNDEDNNAITDKLGVTFTGTFSDVSSNHWSSNVLETGEGKTSLTAAKVTEKLNLSSGAPNKKVTDFKAIGNVTVTIAQP